MTPRCPICGRFARWDGYLGRWWCDRDERKVEVPPPKPKRALEMAR